MIPQSFRRFLAPLALACLAACGQTPSAPRPLVVLAASSLQEAMQAEAEAWMNRERAGQEVRLSFAGSSALARQIDSGAPADLFLSADEDWMDTVEKAGALKAGTRRDLLTNSIVLIAPKASAAAVDLADPASLAAALGNGKLAMADPEAVPAGKYGKAALRYLRAWDEVAGKVAAAENVRAALKLVESGEAPLGVVYVTDAVASRKVRIVATFPANTYPRIRYPVAVLAASTNPQAESFEQFLASPDGQAIFKRYGFGTAG